VRLKKEMDRLSLKVEAVAEACDVSVQGVYKWLKLGQISKEHFPTLRGLKVDIDWVMTGRAAPAPAEQIRLMERPTAILAVPQEGEIVIQQLDVLASMGQGAIPPDHVDVIKTFGANLQELRKRCTFTAPENLQIITGYGESMRPTFSDGDPLLVDVGIREIKVDAVYVFTYDEELFIKRVQRMPGKVLRVISDNRDSHDSWDIGPFDSPRLNVRARVVLACNLKRL